jgi:pimeloyl-ACP methyl ester carboxylesterase
MHMDRRRALQSAALGSVALAGNMAATGAAFAAMPDNPFAVPVPIPPPPVMKESLIEISGARLWVRDTGGAGPVVVLMHPASGSALVWPYQLPAFIKAGYRVIAYSRRGHYGSDPTDGKNGGVASDDLGALMDKLGVGKFALVAGAAGCSVTLDYAISRSDRLTTVVFSCGSFSGVADPAYIALGKRVLVKGFEQMPPEFKELGPSYRAANEKGVEAWVELEHKALNGERGGVKPANKADWTTIPKISAPTLFLAGAADLYAPPAQMRHVASRVPGAEMVVFPECGHSPHWELPDAFNTTVLGFLDRHARRG